jgi:hypothetical protein
MSNTKSEIARVFHTVADQDGGGYGHPMSDFAEMRMWLEREEAMDRHDCAARLIDIGNSTATITINDVRWRGVALPIGRHVMARNWGREGCQRLGNSSSR